MRGFTGHDGSIGPINEFHAKVFRFALNPDMWSIPLIVEMNRRCPSALVRSQEFDGHLGILDAVRSIRTQGIHPGIAAACLSQDAICASSSSSTS